MRLATIALVSLTPSRRGRHEPEGAATPGAKLADTAFGNR